MIVMLLGGLWHGAGVTFLVWGMLHGVYLLVNHGFRNFVVPRLPEALARHTLLRAASWAVTFLAVVVAWVFFRATDYRVAIEIIKAMSGLGEAGKLSMNAHHIWEIALMCVALLSIVVFAPNSQKIAGVSGKFPGVESSDSAAPLPSPPDTLGRHDVAGSTTWYLWQPSKAWAWVFGLSLAAIIASLSQPSEFLYFQF
jgi:hypothetical protein